MNDIAQPERLPPAADARAELAAELDKIEDRLQRTIADGCNAFHDGADSYDRATVAVVRLAALFEERARFTDLLNIASKTERVGIRHTRNLAAHRGDAVIDEDEFWITVTRDMPAFLRKLRDATGLDEADRKAITLTTFRKQRDNERREVLRSPRPVRQAEQGEGNHAMTTPFRELEADALAAMTPEERARFDAALEEEEARLRLAEMVYNAHTAAGLTQTELAARAGTRQSVISAIENGAQIPTIPMLRRIAAAVDRHLNVELAAAS